jgi:phosphocarrier protein
VIAKDAMEVNAKSIMGVMMLAAECGSTVTVRADGPDEAEAIAALEALFSTGFGET